MDASTTNDAHLRKSRTLAAVLEPVIGQVFFSPECHAPRTPSSASPSPGSRQRRRRARRTGLLHEPRIAARTGRPGVVAAAFGVFKPEVVSAGVTLGWSLTDASTIFGARRAGAVASSNGSRARWPRGDACGGVARARGRAALGSRPPVVRRLALVVGRPDRSVDAAVPSRRHAPRVPRRRAHLRVVERGVDAVEIGLLNDIYMGLPLRSYVRTRGWNDDDLAGGVERLRERGWLADDDTLSESGLAAREDFEWATDRAMGRTRRLGRRCGRGRWVTPALGRGDAGGRGLRRRAGRPLAQPQLRFPLRLRLRLWRRSEAVYPRAGRGVRNTFRRGDGVALCRVAWRGRTLLSTVGAPDVGAPAGGVWAVIDLASAERVGLGRSRHRAAEARLDHPDAAPRP